MTPLEFENRIDLINAESKTRFGHLSIYRNSTGYKIASQMIANPDQEIHADISTRRCVTNYAHDAVYILRKVGVKAWVANDAPKGGVQGNFVVICK